MAIDLVGNLKTPKSGAGAPNFTSDRPLFAIPVNYLESTGFPTVDENGVRTTSDFIFKAGYYPIPCYLTSSTKDYSAEVSGDQDAERFKLKVMGNYPGDDTDATEFSVNNLGRGFILVAGNCESSKPAKIIGDICNPLYLKPTFKANKDKTGFEFTWEQSEGSRNLHREYTGTLPTETNQAPTQAPTAVQFLLANVNSVKVAVGSAATVLAVTLVTKTAGQIVTIIGQDTVTANAATLSSSTVFTGDVIILLKDGISWKSLAGSSISFKIFKDAAKTYLVEVSRV